MPSFGLGSKDCEVAIHIRMVPCPNPPLPPYSRMRVRVFPEKFGLLSAKPRLILLIPVL